MIGNGIGFSGVTVDPGSGAVSAANGVHIDAGTGSVYLGGPLVEATSIELNGNDLTIPSIVDDTIVISRFGGMAITLHNEDGNNVALSANGSFEFEFLGVNVLNTREAADSTAIVAAGVSESGNSGPGIFLQAYSVNNALFPRGVGLIGTGNADSMWLQMYGTNSARNKIKFGTVPANQPNAEMILDNVGSLLIARQTSVSAAFKFQMGAGTLDHRALFVGNRPYVLGVQNGAGANMPFYFGATASAAPDGVFTNTAGVEVGRVRNGGGFSVTNDGTNGYGFDGAAANALGLFASAGSIFVRATAGFAFTNSINAQVLLLSDIGDLKVSGSVRTGGVGNVPWDLLNVVVGAAALDTTQYLNVIVNGVPYKLALAV